MHTSYINREFSTLTFNERVLHLANDKRVPLIERFRFLCIFANNIDEFFEIRVGGLKENIAQGLPYESIDGNTAIETYHMIAKKMHDLSKKMYDIFNHTLLPALEKERIYFLKPTQWTPDIQLFAKHYFKHEVLPIISPIALDIAHPFPRLLNKSLNFIVSLSGCDAFNRSIEYAIIHAPRSLPRIISLPSELSDGGIYYIYLSSIIEMHVERLFPGMIIKGCYPFRLTRNSDLFLRDDLIEDLASALQKELFTRHFGREVRLEIDSECPKDMVDFLLEKHHLNEEDLYRCHGPVNIQRFLATLNKIDRLDLCFPPYSPKKLSLEPQTTLFDLLETKDILLQHPYDSFDTIIQFVKDAVKDPNVLAIKQTLYRTIATSAMVDALVEASHLGKEVTAIIELRARFDEASNLALAHRLQEAGVLVLYGVVGYKTHAKMTLIVRKTKNKIKRYVHLSTGNYHEITAQKYTDFGLLTANPIIGIDTDMIFQQLTGLGKAIKLKALYHAPFTLQQQLLYQIEQCIVATQKGTPSTIFMKMNGLTDKKMIDALYNASLAGVQITLVIRSLCCLRPNIKGLSDNIRVISVLGRFLEHHRFYAFHYHETPHFFLSSADLMERNLYHRIEVLFPILDKHIQEQLQVFIDTYQKENMFCFEMKPDGHYELTEKGRESAQNTYLKGILN
jgi:polyphosphate kinase